MNNRKEFDFIPADDRIKAGLLENNIHFLCGEIDEENTLEAIQWITFANLKPGNETLTLYINSEGGSLQDAFALIEMMRKSKKVIRTIGIGSVCSAAFMIFAAGTKGERQISETASIMCHQFSGDASGKYHDIKAAAKENDLANLRMVNLLKEFTEMETRTIKSKLLPPSDVWFTADELIELGVADEIF
jgi:ATP-dependent Clp protease protease subunit